MGPGHWKDCYQTKFMTGFVEVVRYILYTSKVYPVAVMRTTCARQMHIHTPHLQRASTIYCSNLWLGTRTQKRKPARATLTNFLCTDIFGRESVCVCVFVCVCRGGGVHGFTSWAAVWRWRENINSHIMSIMAWARAARELYMYISDPMAKPLDRVRADAAAASLLPHNSPFHHSQRLYQSHRRRQELEYFTCTRSYARSLVCTHLLTVIYKLMPVVGMVAGGWLWMDGLMSGTQGLDGRSGGGGYRLDARCDAVVYEAKP